MTPNSRSYLNRFLAPDTIIPDQNDPLDWDRYSCNRNNPVRYTDPTGHRPLDEDEGALTPPPPFLPSPTPSTPKPPLIIEKIKPTPTPPTIIKPAATTVPPALTSYSDPDNNSAFFVGVNYSYGMPNAYNSAAAELVFGDANSVYLTSSQSGTTTAGGGGSVAIYVGELYNVTDANSYVGPSTSFGGTLSLGPIGITFGTVVGNEDAPAGWYIGYAPGAQASFWYSNNYTEKVDLRGNND